MPNAKPLRIGTLGAALITPTALIRPARDLSGVVVTAVAARNQDRARKFAKKHHIPTVYPTYDALIADPYLDAIYNPLPNSLHASWTIKALRAGKHVLCEKPFASNVDEARHMARVARETGLVLCEAFHYRYHPLIQRVQEVVASGELGRVQHLEAHFCIPFLAPGNIRYRYDLAGGATMDVGCYAIHLLRLLAGREPEVLRAEAGLASAQVDRWMKADLRFSDQLSGHIFCSLFSRVLLRARLEVQGTTGTLRLFNPFQPHRYHRLTIQTRDGIRREKVSGQTSYHHQLIAFVRAICGEQTVPTSPSDAIANMQVIDAIYEKAGLNRRGT